MNLGWKLAQVVNGTSPDSLLDTYQAERHPVAARVLRNTMAQTALLRPDERIDALRDIMSELLSMDEPRKRFAAMMSGLDIHYDLGEGHPLLGRRMPDLDLVTADGPLRVFTLLHDARPVLLNLGEPGGFDITPWADRVQLVDAEYAGTWELPVLGAVTAPAAVLIRPDGYVAWVGDRPTRGSPTRSPPGSGRPPRRSAKVLRPRLDQLLGRPARSSRAGLPGRCRFRTGRAPRVRPDSAVELLAQDVGVPGMAGGLAEQVDHDVEQLHVGARPPRHVAGGVDGERVDRRVRVLPHAPVEADDLVAGLVLGRPQVGAVRGLVVPPGQGLGERAAEDLAEVPGLPDRPGA